VTGPRPPGRLETHTESDALSAAQPVSADWPTNRQTNLRDGNDTTASPFTAISQQWISPTLDGDIYGSPLFVGNKVEEEPAGLEEMWTSQP
jgi:hypothetical protein